MVPTKQSQSDSLQFNVAGLLSGPKGGTRHYELRIPISEMDQLDEAFDIIAPLVGDARFLWTNERIVVVASGETTIRTQCSRCLEPMEQPLSIAIEEAFVPAVDLATGRIRQEEAIDPALLIDAQHILDLSEIMRQALLLALPLTPLCQEDCAGLCPTCGVNLNFEQCTCESAAIDPRWAALGDLFRDQPDDES